MNDKRVDEEGERRRFSSKTLPAYARRSPKVAEVLPILYLHGLSTGDVAPALRDLLGEGASGLSSSSIQRLTEAWQAEHAAFSKRELRFHRYAYLFLDGVNVAVRLGEDAKLCLPVVIGVREDGGKELLAVEDGYRESEDSWSAVLRDLRDRGMNEPRLVTGDGALGAWAALRSSGSPASRHPHHATRGQASTGSSAFSPLSRRRGALDGAVRGAARTSRLVRSHARNRRCPDRGEGESVWDEG